MTPIRRTYGYEIRKRNGELRIRIRWDGSKRTVVSTGFRVNPDKFTGNRCVRSSMHNNIPAVVINRALDDLENKIDMIFYEAEREDIPMTAGMLRAKIIGEKEEAPDLWHTLNSFLIEGERQHQWAFNTVKSIRQVINLLHKFDPALTFETLTADRLDEFVMYQQNHKLYERKWRSGQAGYSNATIIKNCRVVRWMLRWAADKGYIPKEFDTNFRPKLKTVDRPVIFLNWDELMAVYNLDLSNDEMLDRARDFFCFCCFTSLRFSDAYALTTGQVKQGRIELMTQKTGKLLRIELNKYSKAILEKNRGRHGAFALPHVPLDKLNYRLGKVGELAGISEPVTVTRYYGSRLIKRTEPKYKFMTSHCGRRTFICNALALGIAPNVVMKWTGHSEYSAMKPYIDIADEIKACAMSKFDEI